MINDGICADRLHDISSYPLPPAGIIADPLMCSRVYDGLPDAYTDLMFASLECSMHAGRCLYGGMLRLNGWAMGRPAKRRRRLRKSQLLVMDEAFSCETMLTLSPMLDKLRAQDPDLQQVWMFAIHVVDPVTQVEENNESSEHCSHHLSMLMVFEHIAMLFDPLGPQSPVRTVTATALRGIIGIGGIIGYALLDFQVQRLDEHQCVLWCGWFVDRMMEGGDPLAPIPDSDRSAFLDEFIKRLQPGMTGFLLTLFKKTSPVFYAPQTIEL